MELISNELWNYDDKNASYYYKDQVLFTDNENKQRVCETKLISCHKAISQKAFSILIKTILWHLKNDKDKKSINVYPILIIIDNCGGKTVVTVNTNLSNSTEFVFPYYMYDVYDFENLSLENINQNVQFIISPFN